MTILKQFEVDITELELVAEAYSYSRGTKVWHLARAVRSRGFEVEFEPTAGFTPEGGLPAVVGVRLGAIDHFIAILGQKRDKFIVGDPLRGEELLSFAELEQRYNFTGFHMRVKKTRP